MRRITIVMTLLVLGLAAPARAQDASISATLTPNTTKAGSTLHVALLGTAPELSGAIPEAIVLDLQRGFVLDPAAVATPCSRDLAVAGACPAESRIGGGHAVATLSGIAAGDVPATIELFLADRAQASDLASVVMKVTVLNTSRVVVARLLALPSGPFGYELRVDGFGAVVPSFPGLAVALKSLTLDIGAQRDVRTTVVKHRKVRRRGRLVTVRRKVRKVVRHDLVRNPKTCTTGAWTVLATVHVAGTDRSRALTTPCARA